MQGAKTFALYRFTCFTSTKVQILTAEDLLQGAKTFTLYHPAHRKYLEVCVCVCVSVLPHALVAQGRASSLRPHILVA